MGIFGQDQSIYGTFIRASGFGATIFGFTSSVSWGSQSYNINLDVVEDPVQHDDFWFNENNGQMLGGQLIGRPYSFIYGNFRFDGLLKSVEQTNDPGVGNPIYRVTLSSPTEILQACQVVLDDYVGPVNDSVFNSIAQGTQTFQVSNLINIYGWAEDGGLSFGRSLATDVGLPWTTDWGIANGIQTLTSTPPSVANANPTQNWGSYLVYKNNFYIVDVSNLPVPPDFYRLGGAIYMSLMDLLDKFFEDAGVDYIVKLTLNPYNSIGPHTISFVVIPRFVQQQLGVIPDYIANQSNIANVTRGQELRSDITQAFLVGGSINFLQQITNNFGVQLSIIPFFGFDVNGLPIVGYKTNGTQFADDDYAFNLNGSPIADILGEVGNGIYTYPYNSEVGASFIPTLSYPTTILEMRCALISFDSWALYLSVFQPYLADFLNIRGAFDVDNMGNGVQSIVDLVNDSRGLAVSLGRVFQDSHWPAVAQRLYSFVRDSAETYYGKKFIVLLPFNVQVKIDPSTGVTTFNDEIADGGFAVEGTSVLDLNFVNENFFLDQNGLFSPFLRFQYTNFFNSVGTLIPEGNGNLPSLPPKRVFADVTTGQLNAQVVQWEILPDPDDPTQGSPINTKIFARINSPEDPSPVVQGGFTGGGGLIFNVPTNMGISFPGTVVSVSDAIFAQGEDVMGSTMDLAAMMSITPDNGTATKFPILTNALQQLLANRMTSTMFGIHPPAIYPDAVALAIKSNQYVYGPWGQFSADGRLEFEQDEGLVPWEYGSYDQMNLAANAKLNTIAKGNQVLERGSWTEAGLPKASLGDILIAGGPVLTSVSCRVDPGGVTTSYTMETFVNRAGAFIVENQLRLQRIGKIYQQLRRTIRQSILASVAPQTTYNAAYKGFLYGTTYSLQDRSPHAVLTTSLVAGTGFNYIPHATAETYQESLRNIGVNEDGSYSDNVASVGYEAIFRGFTYDLNNEAMSLYLPPDSGYDTSKLIASSGMLNLNPMQEGCDLSWILSGSEYNGMRTSLGATDWGTARGVALRGPMLIQGWGYDFQGAPIPNAGNPLMIDVSEDEFEEFPNPYNKLEVQTNAFFDGYLNHSLDWPTGPLDVRWDKFRGVWMSPGMVICGQISGYDESQGGTPPGPNFTGNTPNVILYVNGVKSNESVYAVNHLDQVYPTGTKVICGYDPFSNRLVIINGDCPPQ